MLNSKFYRRRFMQYSALGAGSALLAACVAPAAPGAAPAAGAAAEAPAAGAAAAGAGKLEIFSWWTSGGEVGALQALYDIYTRDYPGVEIINAALAAQGAGQVVK